MTGAPACADQSSIFFPDSASIKSITERIDALADKVSEDRAERLEMRNVVSQTHMLVKSMGLARLLARTEEAVVMDTDQSCKLDDDIGQCHTEEEEVTDPQVTSIDISKIPNALVKLKTAMDAVNERVSGLAEHCRALASGQVLNYQAIQEVSDNCKQDLDRVSQRMSEFGHKLSKAVQDISETNAQMICNVSRDVSKDMTTLRQDLTSCMGQLEADVTDLRSLREIDVEHAEESDRWLIKHNELIQKQSERFSATIESLLIEQNEKNLLSHTDSDVRAVPHKDLLSYSDSDVRAVAHKKRLQKSSRTVSFSAGAKTAASGAAQGKSCQTSSLKPCPSIDELSPLHIAEHYFIGDDTPAHTKAGIAQSSSRGTQRRAKRADISQKSRRASQVDVGIEGNLTKLAASSLPPSNSSAMVNFFRSQSWSPPASTR